MQWVQRTVLSKAGMTLQRPVSLQPAAQRPRGAPAAAPAAQQQALRRAQQSSSVLATDQAGRRATSLQQRRTSAALQTQPAISRSQPMASAAVWGLRRIHTPQARALLVAAHSHSASSSCRPCSASPCCPLNPPSPRAPAVWRHCLVECCPPASPAPRAATAPSRMSHSWTCLCPYHWARAQRKGDSHARWGLLLPVPADTCVDVLVVGSGCWWSGWGGVGKVHQLLLFNLHSAVAMVCVLLEAY